MDKSVEQCPVEKAIRIIGGKWKLLVLRSLLLNGPQRYNELLSSVTAISPKELTRNLRELTNTGLVARDYGTRGWLGTISRSSARVSCQHSRNC